jgi:hypothetical protein
LNNLWIENVSRSKAMKEVIDVNVSFDTSFEDIELLRVEMEKFVRSPENSRDFQPEFSIGIGGVGDLDKLNLKVAIKHKSNWHNDAVRAARRSKFICALALAMKKVPVYPPGGGSEPLGGHGNPSYSVAVTDDFAARARDDAEKTKEGKRMTNQGPERSNSSSSSKAAELRAVNELNTQNPVVEAAEEWGYDNTLNSRDASAERHAQHMHARESQRGRRKAGDTLPPMPLAENAPGVHVTRAATTSTLVDNYDVERQAGYQAPTTAMYAGAAYAVTQQQQQQLQQQQQQQQVAQDPYAAWQSQQATYGAPTEMQSLQPHPLQSAPSGSGLTGARARGASVGQQSQPQFSRERLPERGRPGPGAGSSS